MGLPLSVIEKIYTVAKKSYKFRIKPNSAFLETPPTEEQIYCMGFIHAAEFVIDELTEKETQLFNNCDNTVN